MVPHGYSDAPQDAALYSRAPGYPGAPQYADRYRQPAANPGASRYAAPPSQPLGYPDASQYASPNPSQFGSPYAMPYAAYAPSAWKRSWGTTMGRWGIGVGVAFITSFLLGMVAEMGEATPEAGGQAAGALAVGTWMYVLLIPWWLDHIIARLGKAWVWAIHGGVSLLLALLNFGYLSAVNGTADPDINLGLGPWMVLVMWAAAYGIGLLLADLLPKSYRPEPS